MEETAEERLRRSRPATVTRTRSACVRCHFSRLVGGIFACPGDDDATIIALRDDELGSYSGVCVPEGCPYIAEHAVNMETNDER